MRSPCPPDECPRVSILSRKWIFDNLLGPFSTFLLFTSGIRTTHPVHGAPIHSWSKFDLFWKTSTSPSLASSINQSIKSQTSSWLQRNHKATQLIAIEGMVFYFICFWKRTEFTEMSDLLSDLMLYPTCIRKIRFLQNRQVKLDAFKLFDDMQTSNA